MKNAFWSHFKHFWRLLEKIYLFPAPSKTTYNLQLDSVLDSFPADMLCPDITGQFVCRHRAKFSSFSGSGVCVCIGEGRGAAAARGLWQIARISYSRLRIPSDTLNCPFPTNIFFPRTYFFSKSPSQHKFAWITDILRNRSIGYPWLDRKIKWRSRKKMATFWFFRLRFGRAYDSVLIFTRSYSAYDSDSNSVTSENQLSE